MKTVEFKVGEKFVVKSGTRRYLWCFAGSMRKYIGTEVEVVEVTHREPKYECKCGDGQTWYFNTEDLEPVAVSESETKSTFTESDMLDGYVCELRNGVVGFWAMGCILVRGSIYDNYNENLIHPHLRTWDIMKVSDCYGKVIWERVEEEEIEEEVDLNLKSYEFVDRFDARLTIAPNHTYGYKEESKDEPILFRVEEDCGDGDNALVGISIKQAKEIISALTEVVEFVEKEVE